MRSGRREVAAPGSDPVTRGCAPRPGCCASGRLRHAAPGTPGSTGGLSSRAIPAVAGSRSSASRTISVLPPLSSVRSRSALTFTRSSCTLWNGLPRGSCAVGVVAVRNDQQGLLAVAACHRVVQRGAATGADVADGPPEPVPARRPVLQQDRRVVEDAGRAPVAGSTAARRLDGGEASFRSTCVRTRRCSDLVELLPAAAPVFLRPDSLWVGWVG